jgi:hypothetical protein
MGNGDRSIARRSRSLEETAVPLTRNLVVLGKSIPVSAAQDIKMAADDEEVALLLPSSVRSRKER